VNYQFKAKKKNQGPTNEDATMLNDGTTMLNERIKELKSIDRAYSV